MDKHGIRNQDVAIFTISNQSLEETLNNLKTVSKTIPNAINIQRKKQGPCTIYPQIVFDGKET